MRYSTVFLASIAATFCSCTSPEPGDQRAATIHAPQVLQAGQAAKPDGGAPAAAARTTGRRERWRYTAYGGGTFRQSEDGWIEQTARGRKRFREVERTAEHVELKPILGGFDVRLTNDRVWVWLRNAWQPTFPGHWESADGKPLHKRPRAPRDLKGPAALRFIGLDQVELANTNGLLNLRQPFTIEMWFRPANQTNVHWLAGNKVGARQHEKVPAGKSAGWHVWWRDAGVGETRNTVGLHSGNCVGHGPSAVHKDKWRHVAVCGDTSNIEIYVDGKRSSRKSVAFLMQQAFPSPINIHLGSNDFEDRLNGHALDGDVRAFQIASDCRYKANFAPPETFEKSKHALVLLDFSRPAGATIHDLSGHGRHGKIKGPTWVAVKE